MTRQQQPAMVIKLPLASTPTGCPVPVGAAEVKFVNFKPEVLAVPLVISSLAVGEAVPIPILPLALMVILSEVLPAPA